MSDGICLERMRADLHVHTTYSDGRDPPDLVVEAAEAGGLDLLAITDHGPALHVGMAEPVIPRYLSAISELKDSTTGVRLLAGIEANIINESGEIDIEERIREKLDILVVGIHRLQRVADPRQMALSYLNSLVRTVERRRVDIIAHPFQFHGDLSRFLEREEIAQLLEAAARRGTAIEINEKYKAPGEDFYRMCLERGVKLSLGSDAHSANSVGKFSWAEGVLRKIGASKSDLFFESI